MHSLVAVLGGARVGGGQAAVGVGVDAQGGAVKLLVGDVAVGQGQDGGGKVNVQANLWRGQGRQKVSRRWAEGGQKVGGVKGRGWELRVGPGTEWGGQSQRTGRRGACGRG